jgi:hypothetical protein
VAQRVPSVRSKAFTLLKMVEIFALREFRLRAQRQATARMDEARVLALGWWDSSRCEESHLTGFRSEKTATILSVTSDWKNSLCVFATGGCYMVKWT